MTVNAASTRESTATSCSSQALGWMSEEQGSWCSVDLPAISSQPAFHPGSVRSPGTGKAGHSCLGDDSCLSLVISWYWWSFFRVWLRRSSLGSFPMLLLFLSNPLCCTPRWLVSLCWCSDASFSLLPSSLHEYGLYSPPWVFTVKQWQNPPDTGRRKKDLLRKPL